MPDFGVCFDVSYRDVYYDYKTATVELETKRTGDVLKSKAILSSAKSVMYVNKRLRNRCVSFSYNLARSPVPTSNMLSMMGTVNSSPYILMGLEYINSKCSRINAIQIATENSSALSYIRIDMEIEIGDEKSVYYTDYPNIDTFFIHPDTKKRCPIQYTTNPEEFLKNKNKFKDAINVADGYGFYTINRPDLNITEPIPINMDGLIDMSGDIYFNRVINTELSDWGILNIPKKIR